MALPYTDYMPAVPVSHLSVTVLANTQPPADLAPKRGDLEQSKDGWLCSSSMLGPTTHPAFIASAHHAGINTVWWGLGRGSNEPPRMTCMWQRQKEAATSLEDMRTHIGATQERPSALHVLVQYDKWAPTLPPFKCSFRAMARLRCVNPSRDLTRVGGGLLMPTCLLMHSCLGFRLL